MISTGWAVVVADERCSLPLLKKQLGRLHEAGTDVCFSRGNGVIVATGGEGGVELLMECAAAYSRAAGCEVSALYGEFGSADFLEVARFDKAGKLLWREATPDAPRSERDALRGYWRVHRELGWKGKRPLLTCFSPEVLSPFGSSWRELERWRSAENEKLETRKLTAAETLARQVARAVGRERLAGISIFIDGEQLGVLTLTAARFEALIKEETPKYLLLQKMPEAAGLLLHHESRYTMSPKRFVAPVVSFDTFAEALGRHLGYAPAIGYARAFAGGGSEFEPVLSKLSPAEWARVFSENRSHARVVQHSPTGDNGTFVRPFVESLLGEELEAQLERHMARHAKDYALLQVELIEAGQPFALDVLLSDDVSVFKKNARYVAALKKLYASDPISRYADALRRVGVDVDARSSKKTRNAATRRRARS